MLTDDRWVVHALDNSCEFFSGKAVKKLFTHTQEESWNTLPNIPSKLVATLKGKNLHPEGVLSFKSRAYFGSKQFISFKSSPIINITKTCLYNFDPLKPHFYIVKLGFTGVYIIFLISCQKHRLWVLVRTASSRRFKWVPTIYFLSRNMKNIRIFDLKNYIFWW